MIIETNFNGHHQFSECENNHLFRVIQLWGTPIIQISATVEKPLTDVYRNSAQIISTKLVSLMTEQGKDRGRQIT